LLFPGGKPIARFGEAALPRLSDEAWQAWTLNGLANAYSLSGQPDRAVPLLERQIAIREEQGVKKNVAIGLGNLASMAQIYVGALAAAEENLRRSIALCCEIEEPFDEAAGHQELGRLLIYCGAFEKAEQELETALEFEALRNDPQGVGVNWAYRALHALLMDDPDDALKAGRQARELADVQRVARDIIRVEWLLGAAHRARGDLAQAEPHLQEALRRCRRINLVELEPNILLALARLRRDQGKVPGTPASSGEVPGTAEARSLAEEALAIADRCEYRLVQADARNVLARLALDEGKLEEARDHAETARERAWCDGPPHRYEAAFREAERLLEEMGERAPHWNSDKPD
jgi:tetratricopeptide (TPR) repeat protein